MNFPIRREMATLLLACVVSIRCLSMLHAGETKRVDVSDPVAAEREFAAMSADDLAKYVSNPKDPQFGWAVSALEKKGNEAILQYIKLMYRNDLGVGWTRPMEALVRIGDKSVAPLVELLKEKNSIARRNAAWALMHRNKPCKVAIGPLIEVLKCTDDEAADYAAAALAPNGQDARDAVPSLIPLAFRLTHSGGPGVAIEKIGLDPILIPNVVKCVSDPTASTEPEEFRVAIGAQLLTAAGKDGVPALTDCLDHEKLPVRLAAALAIQRLGKLAAGERTERALNMALAKNDTRVEAAAAVVAIGASAKAAVPGLMNDLESGQMAVTRGLAYQYQCRAADVLATIPEAVPALISGLESGREMVRIGCMKAIPTNEAAAAQAVPKIKKLLSSTKSMAEQVTAIEALYRMDPKWVREAVGAGRGERNLPPRSWRELAAPIIAAAKAEAENK